MPAVWLILESSGRSGLVGLAVDGQVALTARLDEARRHARDLAPTVSRLLGEVGCQPKHVAGVMVGMGPGSFTGLRIGITSAKAFAYAVGCPLIAVPTFPAIAVRAPHGMVDVISDGLQRHVYCQRFTDGQAVGDLAIRTLADWTATLTPEIAVTGPAVSQYDAGIPSSITRIGESLRLPTIDSLWQVGQSLPPLSQAELFDLEPLYLRGSSAEELAKTKAKGG
jgi:tRNA threonylcarbamoyladenosine biosynthesis protein TsaB